MIAKLAGDCRIRELCCLFGVARSGYYAWKSRDRGKRRSENRRLRDDIRRIHQESDRTYGVARITPELRKLGYRCGRNRVARLMREMGVSPTHTSSSSG